MFRKKQLRAPAAREPAAIVEEVAALEARLGKAEYMRRVFDAEAVQLTQQLLALNQEHAAAVQAKAAAPQEAPQ